MSARADAAILQMSAGTSTDALFADRKPVDPPPIIEVTVREAADPVRYELQCGFQLFSAPLTSEFRQFLQSPYLFMTCSLVAGDEGYGGAQATDEKGLCGTMVSSLHKLKDVDNKGRRLQKMPFPTTS